MGVDVSVVIPTFNEKDSIRELVEQLVSVLGGTGRRYEIVVVDDGSTDGTFEILKQIRKSVPALRVVRLRTNFGQTAATAAGFDHARGEAIITIDADLQNDPVDIPALLEKFDEGYDVVSGWRRKRCDPFFSRRLPSICANWVISRITGVKLHDYGCTLKVYRQEVIRNIELYGEMHRFIPALAKWVGASVIEIPVGHHARKHGRSKYGMGRTTRVILDLITVRFLLSYMTRPIHLFGLLGLGSGFVGFVLAVVLVVQRQFFDKVALANRPMLLLAVLLILLGVQFISMGLLSEMLVRTYHESQGKPIYVMRELLQEEEEPEA